MLHEFKYTSQKKIAFLLLACFLSFLILMIISGTVINHPNKYIGIITMVSSFILPIIIWFGFRRKVIFIGRGTVENEHIIIELDTRVYKFNIQDVKHYSIDNTNGSRLSIKLNSDEKISFQANRNFCDSSKLESFLSFLDQEIIKFKNENPELRIERKKLLHELIADWGEKNSNRIHLAGYTAAIAGVIFIYVGYKSGIYLSHLGFISLAILNFILAIPYSIPPETTKEKIKKSELFKRISLSVLGISSATLLVGLDFYFTSIPGYNFLIGVGLMSIFFALPLFLISSLLTKKSPEWSKIIGPIIYSIIGIMILFDFFSFY